MAGELADALARLHEAEGNRQILLLALAALSLRHPEFEPRCERIARTLRGDADTLRTGPELYDEFRRLLGAP